MTRTDYENAAIETTAEALADAGPVFMVNMVRYREVAHYDAARDLPLCSGREAYFQRYAPAFNTVAQGKDFSVFWVGNVRGVLVGQDGEAWDGIVIVRCASFDVLRKILQSPAYEEQAAPHRRAALADWKFLVTTQPDLPR